ncbi:hypothetical protein Tco_0537325 [Tanacetum coccineum]
MRETSATTLAQQWIVDGVYAFIWDEQNPRCLEDWENLDFQDLVVDGGCWVQIRGESDFGNPGGGRETRGGRDGLEGPRSQLSIVD